MKRKAVDAAEGSKLSKKSRLSKARFGKSHELDEMDGWYTDTYIDDLDQDYKYEVEDDFSD